MRRRKEIVRVIFCGCLDDGIGFNYGSLMRDGQGIRNMCERAKLLGGKLKIDSQMGIGTSINIFLPFILPAT